MNFRKSQRAGIEFLLSNRNSDGGIPAVDLNDVSGFWTTAEAIEILLKNRYISSNELPLLKEMVQFLLDGQLSQGGWCISLGSHNVSTMATGHGVAAMAVAQKVFWEDTVFVDKVKQARESALMQLHQSQNDDGSWGVEPVTDEGKKSRTIAICYALLGYFALGFNNTNSQDVRQAINYMVNSVSKEGGWGEKEGVSSDSANTARVVSILLQSGQYSPDDTLIRKARTFILSSNRAWTFNVESYVVSGAPGQVYFHANTLVDVLEALIRCKYFGRKIVQLMEFFINAQDETTGFWYLCDFSNQDTSIRTWTTSEALGVLDLAHEEYAQHFFDQSGFLRSRHIKQSLVLFIFIATLEMLYILDVHSKIAAKWATLSEGWQQVIVGGCIIGLIVGICANLMSDSVKAMLKKQWKTVTAKRKK